MKQLFLVIVLSTLASSCQREEQSILPTKGSDIAATLWGVDDNHSGVRDDVEDWLLSSDYKENERKALHFLARQYQKLLTTGSEPQEANRVMGEVVHALDCLNLTFGPDLARGARETLKRVQFNSPERVAAYRSASESFSQDKIKDLESYKSKDEVCPF